MRQGQNNKRMRGRGNGRKHSAPRNNSFDSNGPDVKVRGNAQQVVEKYLSLARDAALSGDRVNAESYYQYAEHYYRILNANAPNEQRPGTPSDEANGMDDSASSDDTDGVASADSEETADASSNDSGNQPDGRHENGSGKPNGSRRRNNRRRDPAEEPQPEVVAVATDEPAAEDSGEKADV